MDYDYWLLKDLPDDDEPPLTHAERLAMEEEDNERERFCSAEPPDG